MLQSCRTWTPTRGRRPSSPRRWRRPARRAAAATRASGSAECCGRDEVIKSVLGRYGDQYWTAHYGVATPTYHAPGAQQAADQLQVGVTCHETCHLTSPRHRRGRMRAGRGRCRTTTEPPPSAATPATTQASPGLTPSCGGPTDITTSHYNNPTCHTTNAFVTN